MRWGCQRAHIYCYYVWFPFSFIRSFYICFVPIFFSSKFLFKWQVSQPIFLDVCLILESPYFIHQIWQTWIPYSKLNFSKHLAWNLRSCEFSTVWPSYGTNVRGNIFKGLQRDPTCGSSEFSKPLLWSIFVKGLQLIIRLVAAARFQSQNVLTVMIFEVSASKSKIWGAEPLIYIFYLEVSLDFVRNV